jgi:GGDEF domain-containing protein
LRSQSALERQPTAKLDPFIEGAPSRISPSFGVVFHDGSETEEVLLHRADMAMYEEKRRRVSHLSVVGSRTRLPAVAEPMPASVQAY